MQVSQPFLQKVCVCGKIMSLVSYYNTGLGMGEFGIIFNNAKVQNIFGTWLINISFVYLVFSFLNIRLHASFSFEIGTNAESYTQYCSIPNIQYSILHCKHLLYSHYLDDNKLKILIQYLYLLVSYALLQMYISKKQKQFQIKFLE